MKDNITDLIKFAGYTYPHNKACLICEHVFDFSFNPSIVVHDSDGWLQCLCGEEEHDPELSKTVALSTIINRLPSNELLPLLEPGFFAEKLPCGSWKTTKIDDETDY